MEQTLERKIDNRTFVNNDTAIMVKNYSPKQIRECIQWLVAKDNIDKAFEVSRESLNQYPENEEVIAISSLVSVVRQDWNDSITLLKKLHKIQGARTAPLTYKLLVRSLRCNKELQEALKFSRSSICSYPDDYELVKDCAEIAEELHDYKIAMAALELQINLEGGESKETKIRLQQVKKNMNLLKK